MGLKLSNSYPDSVDDLWTTFLGPQAMRTCINRGKMVRSRGLAFTKERVSFTTKKRALEKKKRRSSISFPSVLNMSMCNQTSF